MAKPTEDIVNDIEVNEVDEVGPEDFIFIVTADGELKSVLFPDDDVFEYNERVLKVFEVFGIDDPDSLTPYTLH